MSSASAHLWVPSGVRKGMFHPCRRGRVGCWSQGPSKKLSWIRTLTPTHVLAAESWEGWDVT